MYLARIKSYFWRQRGLSLQEMLIVVAVFAILAIIFFFSSAQMMTRTGVSRVRSDQRQISDALAAFHAENSNFPSTRTGLTALVSPSKFLGEIPLDPFATQKSVYKYHRIPMGQGTTLWALVSAGPDGDYDFMPSDGPRGASVDDGDGDWGAADDAQAQAIIESLASQTYDPTNGTKSNGDVIRFNIAPTAGWN